ncbi:hypothetical protein GCM10010339_49540 [Streptomyces alanosinicus]|uniref:Uncharacterized protein n=1 Tax=Streptomyces alanosinicus TaxID=68171 RepID=A0A918YL14_9ACTN|nr:hypothetical protein GCM10010339_49540 [Streptomyces alanosinicus]
MPGMGLPGMGLPGMGTSRSGGTGEARASAPETSVSAEARGAQPAAARTRGSTCPLPDRRSRRAATASVQPESV